MTASLLSEKRTNVRFNSADKRWNHWWVPLIGGASQLMPGLMGRIAVRWFTRPRRFPRPEAEHAVLQGGRRFELSCGVPAWSWGQGPVVLLVHGWEGRGAQLGAFVQPLVDAGYRVVAFDAKAHGNSAGTHANLGDFAEAILAVERRVGDIHAVIAHSAGCPATTLALRRGLKTNALVYVAPPATLDMMTGYFAELTGLSAAALDTMKTRLTELIHVTFEDMKVQSFGPQMRTPLYVVHDSQDRDVSLNSGLQYQKYWDSSHLLVTHGLGHRRVLRDATVVREVVGFVRSVQPPSRRTGLADWLETQPLSELPGLRI